MRIAVEPGPIYDRLSRNIIQDKISRIYPWHCDIFHHLLRPFGVFRRRSHQLSLRHFEHWRLASIPTGFFHNSEEYQKGQLQAAPRLQRLLPLALDQR